VWFPLLSWVRSLHEADRHRSNPELCARPVVNEERFRMKKPRSGAHWRDHRSGNAAAYATIEKRERAK
jgi:hypothetical protein